MKRVGLTFAFVFAILVSCASAQDNCSDCLDPKPTCPQYQEPTCDGGTWVCPDPICDPWDRRICEEEWCGIWDDRTCTCDVLPGGCGGCDPHDRDRCFEECNYDDRCWDDQLCICRDPNDLRGDVPMGRTAPRGRRFFLGRFPPPSMTSCEERKIPTSLAWDVGELRFHNGDPIVVEDPSGRTPPRQLADMAWGISRPLQYAVLDQNGDLLQEGGMQATERLELQDANPWPNEFIATVQVPVGDNGIFFDVYAFFGRSIIFRPQIGHYRQVKQRIYVTKDGEHHVRTNCIRMTHDEINARECN